MKRNLFLNGLPDLLILRLLSRGEMYGYQIVVQVNLLSKNAFRFGEGCIYPILHRMAAQGHLLQRREKVKGRLRRYYRLSASGKKQLLAANHRWSVVTGAVNNIASHT